MKVFYIVALIASFIAPPQQSFHIGTNALATATYETTASYVAVDVNTTMPLGDITINDTTYYTSYGEMRIVHYLPAGTKRVTITQGGQSVYKGTVVGTYITAIFFDAPAVEIADNRKRVVVYGDSLSVGGNVYNSSAQTWTVLLRKRYAVDVQGYGYRNLYWDAAHGVDRDKLVADITSHNADYIWLAIGTNDYAFELWSAKDFGATYAATLNKLHAVNPQARIFAQSPIVRADEYARQYGDTLSDYRRQIETACNVRAWCTFVDGTRAAFPQLDELHADGLHLTAASSVKYAAAVASVLKNWNRKERCE